MALTLLRGVHRGTPEETLALLGMVPCSLFFPLMQCLDYWKPFLCKRGCRSQVTRTSPPCFLPANVGMVALVGGGALLFQAGRVRPGSVPFPAQITSVRPPVRPPGFWCVRRPRVLLLRRQMLKRGALPAPGLFPRAGARPGSSLRLGLGDPP